jgi:predicted RNA-binding protein YlxR (DUF448 family)/ribosomal protein L7Ae-like RNA K-turn-binding protein
VSGGQIVALTDMAPIETMGVDASLGATDDATDAPMTGPLRRCIVTREVLPKESLVRFVVGPAVDAVPDIAGKLPGRGLWVKAERAVLASAVAKNLFAKAARQSVTVPADLVDRTVVLLSRRCLDLIGLARRAGQAVCGFEKVRDALRNGRVGLVLAAVDGAADGRGKLEALAGELPILAQFTVAELSAALGRENVVHAALAPGRLAERLIVDSARLAGLHADKVS